MSSVRVICVRHKFFWWLNGRWHVHITKPVEQLGSKDIELEEMIRNLRWYRVETWTERMP